jgi:hypothetical protein
MVIKKIILFTLIILSIGIIFRGWIYRNTMTYISVGQRQTYNASNQDLIFYIESIAEDKIDFTIDQIIHVSLTATSKKLNYTFAKNDTDPNLLIDSMSAHCIGYASFFVTVCNYLLKKNNLDHVWAVKPQIGKMYALGYNLHEYFNHPYFKDHDFVSIENKITGETFALDPTINDYLGIVYITFKN